MSNRIEAFYRLMEQLEETMVGSSVDNTSTQSNNQDQVSAQQKLDNDLNNAELKNSKAALAINKFLGLGSRIIGDAINNTVRDLCFTGKDASLIGLAEDIKWDICSISIENTGFSRSFAYDLFHRELPFKTDLSGLYIPFKEWGIPHKVEQYSKEISGIFNKNLIKIVSENNLIELLGKELDSHQKDHVRNFCQHPSLELIKEAVSEPFVEAIDVHLPIYENDFITFLCTLDGVEGMLNTQETQEL